MMEKIRWIREVCTEKFEGIPCGYPQCGCANSNWNEMRRLWEERDENHKPDFDFNIR